MDLTVAEFIEFLSRCKQDAVVVIAAEDFQGEGDFVALEFALANAQDEKEG